MSLSQTSESSDYDAIVNATATAATTITNFSQTTTFHFPELPPLTPLNSSRTSSPMPSSPSEPGNGDSNNNTDEVTSLFGNHTGGGDYNVAISSLQHHVMHFLGDRIDKNNQC
jgi:hypothetical protein